LRISSQPTYLWIFTDETTVRRNDVSERDSNFTCDFKQSFVSTVETLHLITESLLFFNSKYILSQLQVNRCIKRLPETKFLLFTVVPILNRTVVTSYSTIDFTETSTRRTVEVFSR